MKVTYIHHSSFLVETNSCYYLFDYEKGNILKLDINKAIYVFSSHSHHDHYNANIFSILNDMGMKNIYAVLSDDIKPPVNIDVLQVSFGKEYELYHGQKITTFESTDLGVAFLIEDNNKIIYHAGDLNDWVWDGQ